MSDFIEALCNPEILFLRYALLVGLLASISFGVIGTYVVARRISYIAGAIAHSVLGGIGVGLFLQRQCGVRWLDPMFGAVVAALGAAAVIGLVSLHARQREDTVIGAVWAIGMAVGLLFVAKTPGYVDPMSYLFGNILLLSKSDLWLVGVVDVITAGLGILFYHKLLAVCFDHEHLRLRGVHADAYYIMLLMMTALTVVLMVNIVGVVMVIALITLPAAVAGFFAQRLWQMMVLAVLFSMVFTTTGIGFSYMLDLPTGPTIIVFAGAVFLGCAAVDRLRSLIKRRSRM